MLPRDLSGPVAHLRTVDRRLAPVLDTVTPYDLGGREAGLAGLCTCIIGQQLSLASAASIARRFHDRYGHGPAFDGDAVLAAPDDELRASGLSRAKADAIRAVIRHWVARGLSEERLAPMGDEEITGLLTEVRGIGPWTVQMFLIFHMRRADVLPVGDLGFRAGLARLHRLDDYPDADAVARLCRKWTPWSTVGTLYTWAWLAAEQRRERAGERSATGKTRRKD